MKVGDLVNNPCFYLDTSAIIKRYFFENGTDFVNNLYNIGKDKGIRLYTAKHSIAEVSSATFRLHREGKFSFQEANSIIIKFMRESLDSLNFIDTDDTLYACSIIVLSRNNLRAGDAMHLAAALDLYTVHGASLHFVSDDSRQCDSAFSEGFCVLRPREADSIEYLNSLILPDENSENYK